MVLGIWGWMATMANLDLGYSVKRMSPDTIAHFDADWTLAAIALGHELAGSYTWPSGIGLEIHDLK